jgi:hypothetical protein
VVQLELWDAYSIVGDDEWRYSPWNPDNNVNYKYGNTRLRTSLSSDMDRNFFKAAVNGDRVLLDYQKRFAKKLLEVSSRFDNVLYQIDNESYLPHEVSAFWASYLHGEANRLIYVADSRRYHPPSFKRLRLQDISHPENRFPVYHPELFSYLDLSQNGGHSGQTQYDNLIWYRAQAAAIAPRPINHVKTYRFDWPVGTGFNSRKAQSELEGTRKLWRTVFAWGASVRFHRRNSLLPAPGLGLGPAAVIHLKSMRALLNRFDVPSSQPANQLLGKRTTDEAYALEQPARGRLPAGDLAVYFTGNGDRSIVIQLAEPHRITWLNIEKIQLTSRQTEVKGQVTLTAPGGGQWVAVLEK